MERKVSQEARVSSSHWTPHLHLLLTALFIGAFYKIVKLLFIFLLEFCFFVGVGVLQVNLFQPLCWLFFSNLPFKVQFP
jgi:hypothetical protein